MSVGTGILDGDQRRPGAWGNTLSALVTRPGLSVYRPVLSTRVLTSSKGISHLRVSPKSVHGCRFSCIRAQLSSQPTFWNWVMHCPPQRRLARHVLAKTRLARLMAGTHREGG